jgi:DNA-binding CsgD family transcriptional regulator
MADALSELQNGLWLDANEAPDLASFRRSTLIRLAKVIGFDSATIVPAPHPLGYDDASEVISLEYDPLLLQHFVEGRVRYWDELRPFVPAGTTSCLGAAVTFRGHSTCTLALNRCDSARPFQRRDLENLRSLLPALGIADAAVVARCASGGGVPKTFARPSGTRSADALTRREREVASLISLGLQNKQIAASLGTSVETVRKQTISVYSKLGVSGRVALAVRFMGELKE